MLISCLRRKFFSYHIKDQSYHIKDQTVLHIFSLRGVIIMLVAFTELIIETNVFKISNLLKQFDSSTFCNNTNIHLELVPVLRESISTYL